MTFVGACTSALSESSGKVLLDRNEPTLGSLVFGEDLPADGGTLH